MPRSLRLTRTLLHGARVHLAVGCDELDQLYLCILDNPQEDADAFLTVPVTTSRVRDLEQGLLDIRSAFQLPEVREWYQIRKAADERRWVLQPGTEPTDTRLPAADLMLPELTEVSPGKSEITDELVTRNKAIVHLRLSPPESRAGLRIDASHLAQGLTAFQNLVRQAYRRTLQEADTERRTVRAADWTLELFALSQGKVHLHSKSDADLFGYVAIAKALEKIDDLTEHAADPEMALEVMRQNRGHLVDACKRFLRFVAQPDSFFSYEWVSPASTQVHGRAVSSSQAEKLLQVLVAQQDLAVEQVTARGVFFRANARSGVWAFHDESGEDLDGRSASDVSLGGVVLERQRYELACLEKVEQSGDGELTTTLELTGLRELQV